MIKLNDARARKSRFIYWNIHFLCAGPDGRFLILTVMMNQNSDGEIALASMIKNCRVFLITSGFEDDFIDNLVPLFGKKLRVDWKYYNYEELADLKSMKKDIRRWLKDFRWI